MDFHELNIRGAFEVTPQIFGDSRGTFFEAFRADKLTQQIGYPFVVRQANSSHSQRGVFRGIHFAEVPRGQAKYVSVSRGKILDYIVDLRRGSPTYKSWESVELSSDNKKSVYIPEGCGHAFLSLEDDTVVNYLVSDVYRPSKEHGIHPLDPEIGLIIPIPVQELLISDKDQTAPSFSAQEDAGLLSSVEEIAEFQRKLRESEKS